MQRDDDAAAIADRKHRKTADQKRDDADHQRSHPIVPVHPHQFRITGEVRSVLENLFLGVAFVGHAASNVTGAEAVVTSSAVHADNPEVVQARQMAIPVVPRAQMLAELREEIDRIDGEMHELLDELLNVILFAFIGILILALGIIGEYVGRIYNEVRNRPLYLVRETMGLEANNLRTDGNDSWSAAPINGSINAKAKSSIR